MSKNNLQQNTLDTKKLSQNNSTPLTGRALGKEEKKLSISNPFVSIPLAVGSSARPSGQHLRAQLSETSCQGPAGQHLRAHLSWPSG